MQRGVHAVPVTEVSFSVRFMSVRFKEELYRQDYKDYLCLEATFQFFFGLGPRKLAQLEDYWCYWLYSTQDVNRLHMQWNMFSRSTLSLAKAYSKSGFIPTRKLVRTQWSTSDNHKEMFTFGKVSQLRRIEKNYRVTDSSIFEGSTPRRCERSL